MACVRNLIKVLQLCVKKLVAKIKSSIFNMPLRKYLGASTLQKGVIWQLFELSWHFRASKSIITCMASIRTFYHTSNAGHACNILFSFSLWTE